MSINKNCSSILFQSSSAKFMTELFRKTFKQQYANSFLSGLELKTHQPFALETISHHCTIHRNEEAACAQLLFCSTQKPFYRLPKIKKWICAKKRKL